MTKFRTLPLFALLAAIIAACDTNPRGVLPPDKMEAVLYDYHIAQGLISQTPAAEREKTAGEYTDAVFAKHQITEAQFDTSVVYYSRHTKELYEIYGRIKERYMAANEEIQTANGNNEMMAVFSTGGDTTNLWNSSSLLPLRPNGLLGKTSFTIHADTAFHSGDRFILTLSPHFIQEPGRNPDIGLVMGLSVRYNTDRQSGSTRYVNSSVPQQLTLQALADETIKSVTGFLYYQGDPSSRNLCVIDNISLVRMHSAPVPEPVRAPGDSLRPDTTSVDTISADTLTSELPVRMSPEDRRQQNKTRQQIKIQQAPSVRTPNSIGPRRRRIRD